MSDILTHAEAGVMTITLNRLDRKNSITAAMYGAMADALATAEADTSIRVVVLQGHETVFSAGNDIGDFLNKPPAGMDSPVFRFLHGIAMFTKPLLAAVCGPAVGVGTTMLFHCDLVYAGDNAAFSVPFVNLGLCPEAASSLSLPSPPLTTSSSEPLLMTSLPPPPSIVSSPLPPSIVAGTEMSEATLAVSTPARRLMTMEVVSATGERATSDPSRVATRSVPDRTTSITSSACVPLTVMTANSRRDSSGSAATGRRLPALVRGETCHECRAARDFGDMGFLLPRRLTATT